MERESLTCFRAQRRLACEKQELDSMIYECADRRRRFKSKKSSAYCNAYSLVKLVFMLFLSWVCVSAEVRGAQVQRDSIELVAVGSAGQTLKTEAGSAKALSMAKAGRANYAGEFYRVDGRKIHLLRSLEKIAVRHLPSQGPSVMSSLETVGQPQREFLVDREVSEQGITVLRTSKLASLDELTESIHQFERTPGVLRAVPVYIHEESGLELIPTDEFIVKLAAGAGYAELEAINEVMGATVVRGLRGTADQLILALPGCTPEELLAACEMYWQDPAIEWAEPDFLGQVVKCDFTPNDPLYNDQWHLPNIGAPQAWDTTTGSSEIIIAVLDDGMDLEHEDLRQNLPSNDNEIPGNGIDDDGNGWIDDCNGWDFHNNDNDPNPADPGDNHGTATAGVAAAKGDNNLGVASCAFDCKLMPLKVVMGEQGLYPGRLAEGLYYAAGRTKNSERWRGADVISISLGFSRFNVIDEALEYAVTQGRGGKGCPIFCASGNDATGYVWHGGSTSGLDGGTYVLEFEYYKDPAGSDGDDRVWIADVILPDEAETKERFSSGSMPAGWLSAGDVGFEIVDDPAHAYGTGRYVARSGRIGDSQRSILRTGPFTLVPGKQFSFRGWISSEKGTDDLNERGNPRYPPDGDDGDWLMVWFCKPDGDRFGFSVDAGVPGDRRNVPGEPVGTKVIYPASHADTIAVGASTDFDYRADYSQYGPELDFVAPSGGGTLRITTTDRTGRAGYNASGDYVVFFSGTSSSAPLAAGVAALMLSKDPDLTAPEVRRIMQESCEQVGGVTYTDARNEYYGHGRINAQAAIGPLDYVIYVDGDAEPGGDGSNWATAFVDLQDALKVAADFGGAGKEILVAAGIYRPDRGATLERGDSNATFQLINGVAVKGGYAGLGRVDPNTRDIYLYETILSGDLNGDDVDVADPCELPAEPTRRDNSAHVVTGSGTDHTALLDGFTITGGNAPDKGGGLYITSCEGPTISRCIFVENTAKNSGGGIFCHESSPKVLHCTFTENVVSTICGGAILLEQDSSPTIRDCHFQGNRGRWGGAVYISGNSNPTISACRFQANIATEHFGGGIGMQDNCSPAIHDCIFIGNTARAGGGIIVLRSNALVANCIFEANIARQLPGGGINVTDSVAQIVNCVFVANRAEWGGGLAAQADSLAAITNCSMYNNEASGGGSGVYVNYASSATVANCIVWVNDAAPDTSLIHGHHEGTELTIAYSDIEGGFDGPRVVMEQGAIRIDGGRNISDPPDFIDVDSNDLRLLSTSPCIDAGDIEALPSDVLDLDGDGDAREPIPFDLDGNPRIANGIVDMGAYEHDPNLLGR